MLVNWHNFRPTKVTNKSYIFYCNKYYVNTFSGQIEVRKQFIESIKYRVSHRTVSLAPRVNYYDVFSKDSRMLIRKTSWG